MSEVNYIQMDSKKCSGCGACAAICPIDAIRLYADKEGFLVPVVDTKKCISCGLCSSSCPALHRRKPGFVLRNAYAVKSVDESVKSLSASGSFFPAVAKEILNMGGYVCGCILDNLEVKHIVTNEWEDVLRMQDSKYVQSNMGGCISRILELLKKKEYVLFTGTSCQVAGVKAAVGAEGVSDEKLFCMDFFCHGVPSPMIWNDYLKFYSKKKDRTVVGYRFRSKEYGWGKKARSSNHLNTVFFQKSGRGDVKKDNVSWASRMWRSIFFSNLCIRPYCHACPYATVDKPSDITMGDFWGIENVAPEFDDGKGCSCVVIHSEKAKALYDGLNGIKKIEVAVEDLTKRQPRAFSPISPGDRREKFWRDYFDKGFEYVANNYFGYSLKDRIKSFTKRILFALKLGEAY